MVLYGYNVQAFRLPFTTQHSPMVEQAITTDDNNGKSTIPGNSNEKHYYYGVQHSKATNLHPLVAMAE